MNLRVRESFSATCMSPAGQPGPISLTVYARLRRDTAQRKENLPKKYPLGGPAEGSTSDDASDQTQPLQCVSRVERQNVDGRPAGVCFVSSFKTHGR